MAPVANQPKGRTKGEQKGNRQQTDKQNPELCLGNTERSTSSEHAELETGPRRSHQLPSNCKTTRDITREGQTQIQQPRSPTSQYIGRIQDLPRPNHNQYTTPTEESVEPAIEKPKDDRPERLIISQSSEIVVALKPATPSLQQATARRPRLPDGRGDAA